MVCEFTIFLTFFETTHELADADATSAFVELRVVYPPLRFLVLYAEFVGNELVGNAFDPAMSEPGHEGSALEFDGLE